MRYFDARDGRDRVGLFGMSASVLCLTLVGVDVLVHNEMTQFGYVSGAVGVVTAFVAFCLYVSEHQHMQSYEGDLDRVGGTD